MMENYYFAKVPEYKWEFRYTKGDNIAYMKEIAPGFFHRLMQRLILGVEWKRIGD